MIGQNSQKIPAPSILNLVNEIEKARRNLRVCSTPSLLPGSSGQHFPGHPLPDELAPWLQLCTLLRLSVQKSSPSCVLSAQLHVSHFKLCWARCFQILADNSFCILVYTPDLHHIKLISSGIIAKSFKISHEGCFESNNKLIFSVGWNLGQGTCWLKSIYQGTKSQRCWPCLMSVCCIILSKLSFCYLCFLLFMLGHSYCCGSWEPLAGWMALPSEKVVTNRTWEVVP